MNDCFRHFVRTDAEGYVIKGFSDAFEQPMEGDILINEKGGYQFRLYPGDEENPILFNECGVPLFRWDGQAVAARPQDEVEGDSKALKPGPDPMEILKKDDTLQKARIQALDERGDFIEDCIAEMALLIYE